jgi:hypothetical protein
VKKLEAGAFDDDARAADLLEEYEAKIAALERMVGNRDGALQRTEHVRRHMTSATGQLLPIEAMAAMSALSNFGLQSDRTEASLSANDVLLASRHQIAVKSRVIYRPKKN